MIVVMDWPRVQYAPFCNLENWGGYLTAILAPITFILLLNHAAELPFMDAIGAPKE
jgi:hypothetical protein